MERTFLMVKPDGVARGLLGEVLRRVEGKGLKITAMKMLRVDEPLGKRHYEEHREKPFFPGLISFITSGPSVAMVVEGRDAIKVMRAMIGKTDPKEASPGTIRGDFGLDVGKNIVHASDSKSSAEREMALYFAPEELLTYSRADEPWVYEE
ncbi:MAG: nucleoside-diphosphate kinase [Euryarchaeota archaeon]|nr:nucleoside-diphosphate kinase [Euryarchaeota archaeon]